MDGYDESVDDLSGRLGDRGDTPVPVRLQNGGDVVVDQPVPWGRFLEINGSQHVPRHLEQLRALRHSS